MQQPRATLALHHSYGTIIANIYHQTKQLERAFEVITIAHSPSRIKAEKGGPATDQPLIRLQNVVSSSNPGGFWG